MKCKGCKYLLENDGGGGPDEHCSCGHPDANDGDGILLNALALGMEVHWVGIRFGNFNWPTDFDAKYVTACCGYQGRVPVGGGMYWEAQAKEYAERIAALEAEITELRGEPDIAIVGVPCGCRGMTDAVLFGLVQVRTITSGGRRAPVIGVASPDMFSPFQWCPWCGNAAIEIKEVHSDEQTA